MYYFNMLIYIIKVLFEKFCFRKIKLCKLLSLAVQLILYMCTYKLCQKYYITLFKAEKRSNLERSELQKKKK